LDIKKVLEHIGDNPTASELYFVGDYYMGQENYRQAILFFDKILEEDDKLLVEAKYAKVSALIELQEAGFIKSILESLPSDQRNEIKFLEGMLMADFFLDKWTAKTVFYYDKLKEGYPQSEIFDYMDVLHYVSKKDTSMAIVTLNPLISKAPQDVRLKLIYLKLKCCEDSVSKTMIDELLVLSPKNTQVQNYYLEILVDENLIDSAFVESQKYSSVKNTLGKEILEELIKNRNNNSEMYLDWLILNEKLTKFEELRYRGDIFYEKKYNYKAKIEYRKALEIKSNDEYVQKRMRSISWRINNAAEQIINTDNESN
jgi:tetratricopeptide (TPR) repeat protein